MKFSKSVLAISIALAVSGSVGAATKQKEEDSVREWGRWAVLMPAAGLEEGPGFAAIPAGNDLGSCQSSENCPKVSAAVEPPAPPPPPPPPVVEGHCVAGAACGYATYEYFDTSGYDGYGGDGGEGAPVPANIDLDVQFAPVTNTAQPAAIGIPGDGGEQNVTAIFSITPRDAHENYPNLADRQAGPTNNYIGDADGPFHWYAYNYDYNQQARIEGGMYPALTEATTAGWWFDGAEGNYDGEYGYAWVYREGAYVSGIATDTAFLDRLNAGNVQADYTGFALRNDVPVEIHIDFGNDTWRGTWNGGRDGNVRVATDENGVRYVEGEVGFRANGVVSGPNVVATRLSAADATRVTGRVEGSFFGSRAQVLGGVSDITKTVTADTVGDGGATYSRARNVDVFVTVEKSIADQVGNTFRTRD